ncbi:hypothetical protein OSB04_002915 [Centaurea solstitialis]|uniref:Uncharacterized protein n=1 Tax=Centaurea solstitialis TaxID=347529 RepID=A0AA38TVN2_9ASTR|nr:hypothetical protein OSB04_002915 [Centaurea solstitialis]
MTKDTTPESSIKPVSLHPAYSVSNIQSKIRTLDGSKVTYSAWVKLFRLHAVAYKVENHIDDSPPPAATSPEYDQWKELDALVLQWIYSTVSDVLLKRLMDTNVARAAWTKLEKIFLGNKKARVAALETRFCNLTLTACSSVEDVRIMCETVTGYRVQCYKTLVVEFLSFITRTMLIDGGTTAVSRIKPPDRLRAMVVAMVALAPLFAGGCTAKPPRPPAASLGGGGGRIFRSH